MLRTRQRTAPHGNEHKRSDDCEHGGHLEDPIVRPPARFSVREDGIVQPKAHLLLLDYHFLHRPGDVKFVDSLHERPLRGRPLSPGKVEDGETLIVRQSEGRLQDLRNDLPVFQQDHVERVAVPGNTRDCIPSCEDVSTRTQ